MKIVNLMRAGAAAAAAVAMVVLTTAACGGLSPDALDDLLGQVPTDVNAVAVIDVDEVTRTPMWSALESDLEELIPAALRSFVDVGEDVRYVVACVRGSDPETAEELVIVSGTFDWPGADAVETADGGVVDTVEGVEVISVGDDGAFVGGSVDPGFLFFGSESLVVDLLAARAGDSAAVASNARLMRLREHVTAEADAWMIGVTDGATIEDVMGIPLSAIDGIAATADVNEGVAVRAVVEMADAQSAGAVGVALGLARMLVPPRISESLTIEVVESDVQLAFALDGAQVVELVDEVR